MSDKLRKQIEVERQQLRYLIEVHHSLLIECESREPTAIELSALAFFLETFYSGIENIFKRIAVELGGDLPQGDAWHRKLLNAATNSTSQRARIVSDELKNSLEEHLAFRHVSRNAYSFHLQWPKMAPLVSSCQRPSNNWNANSKNFCRRFLRSNTNNRRLLFNLSWRQLD